MTRRALSMVVVGALAASCADDGQRPVNSVIRVADCRSGDALPIDDARALAPEQVDHLERYAGGPHEYPYDCPDGSSGVVAVELARVVYLGDPVVMEGELNACSGVIPGAQVEVTVRGFEVDGVALGDFTVQAILDVGDAGSSVNAVASATHDVDALPSWDTVVVGLEWRADGADHLDLGVSRSSVSGGIGVGSVMYCSVGGREKEMTTKIDVEAATQFL